MTIDQHLAHLLWLMSPPFADAWKAYAWARAKEIAADPEHAALPEMLAAAMRAKATATAGEATT